MGRREELYSCDVKLRGQVYISEGETASKTMNERRFYDVQSANIQSGRLILVVTLQSHLSKTLLDVTPVSNNRETSKHRRNIEQKKITRFYAHTFFIEYEQNFLSFSRFRDAY